MRVRYSFFVTLVGIFLNSCYSSKVSQPEFFDISKNIEITCQTVKDSFYLATPVYIVRTIKNLTNEGFTFTHDHFEDLIQFWDGDGNLVGQNFSASYFGPDTTKLMDSVTVRSMELNQQYGKTFASDYLGYERLRTDVHYYHFLAPGNYAIRLFITPYTKELALGSKTVTVENSDYRCYSNIDTIRIVKPVGDDSVALTQYFEGLDLREKGSYLDAYDKLVDVAFKYPSSIYIPEALRKISWHTLEQLDIRYLLEDIERIKGNWEQYMQNRTGEEREEIIKFIYRILHTNGNEEYASSFLLELREISQRSGTRNLVNIYLNRIQEW